jgi:hypothetical protein
MLIEQFLPKSTVNNLSLGIIILNIVLGIVLPGRSETSQAPTSNSNSLDLSPEIIKDSPVLQRWLQNIPNVLEKIDNDPSFRTRVQFGYSQFPSSHQSGGFTVGVQDVFLGKTPLTISGHYQGSFNGNRKNTGADLQYYLLPLGNYINLAPVVGYRYLATHNYATNGVNLGAKLRLVLSRNDAADITVTQSFVSPGGSQEVGITTLSVGYAFTKNLRLSTSIQQQNSLAAKDSEVGIILEWMP